MSNPYSKRNYHNYPQQQPRSQNKVHINPRFSGAPPPTTSSSSVPSTSASNYADIPASLPTNSKVIVNPKV